MMKNTKRIFSFVIGFALLVSVPSYGSAVPLVQPFPHSYDQTQNQNGPSGTGVDNSQKSDTQENNKTEGTGSQSVTKPEIASEGAFLLDASSGEVLYSKNGETRYYPASITKLMTALIVAERSKLSDTVVFSKTATTNLESGAVTLSLTEGDKLTVEQCLYGLMLRSANEVANGLAEHTAGSIGSFAGMMNAKAKALGCTNTNFVNPNGLNNTNHYTTPHDMALIAKAAFENDIVRKVCATKSYQIPATKKASARTITMGHKMIKSSDSRYYPGVIGGKTGYTSLAGNTLVTCAEKDGVRLLAVVLKSKSTHYADTKALLDYGFALKGGQALSKQEQTSGWIKIVSRWYYKKSDGNRACNEWLKIDGSYYWFDSDSAMATGFRQFSNNAWYYFHSNGAMAENYWVKSKEKWYYMGEDGAMLKDTVTPDGYRLNADGAWNL
ncbi:D-alanyl-D-alanine carboxypeptidase family protein [Clostridium sp. E02]|uniref:serine hydrolase n=1 Tax=Clostridium sp. E02 TaxID=2487134 RepID=UPI000F544A8B|nr:D-alanyl-D-alanine carboxypeptidase family protein [Clostridium sp. E02]